MYTERQIQIINHFQATYKLYGRNEAQMSILVWTDNGKLDFIYPQELDELIEAGCPFFSRIAPKSVNMWTSSDYRVNCSILEWESQSLVNLTLEYAIKNYWFYIQRVPDVRRSLAAKVIIQQEASAEEADEILSDIDNRPITEPGINAYAMSMALDWQRARRAYLD